VLYPNSKCPSGQRPSVVTGPRRRERGRGGANGAEAARTRAKERCIDRAAIDEGVRKHRNGASVFQLPDPDGFVASRNDHAAVGVTGGG